MSVYDLPPMTSAEVWVGVLVAVIVGWWCVRATRKAEKRYTSRLLQTKPVSGQKAGSTPRQNEKDKV